MFIFKYNIIFKEPIHKKTAPTVTEINDQNVNTKLFIITVFILKGPPFFVTQELHSKFEKERR